MPQQLFNFVCLITFFVYLATTLQQYRLVFNHHTLAKKYYWLGSIGALAGHGLFLYWLIEKPEGQNLTPAIMLSTIIWVMNIFNVLFSLRQPSERLIIFMYPLAAISLVLLSVSKNMTIIQTGQDPLMLTHILISLAAVSFIFMSGFWALMLAWQNYLLKSHSHHKALLLLPPIQTMEKNLFFVIFIGFIFLSGTLVTGFIFDGISINSKSLFTSLAWSVFVLLLIGQSLLGWRGTTAIRFTLTGVSLVTLAYFGTKIIFKF